MMNSRVKDELAGNQLVADSISGSFSSQISALHRLDDHLDHGWIAARDHAVG